MTDRVVSDAGIEVRSVYEAADIAGDVQQRLGLPGQPPFTRGVRPRMYRDTPWAIRQLAGYGTAADTNRRLRMLLAHGATAVNTVFDFVTNRGYDSDDAFAVGDVGQGGVAVDSVEDMLTLYDGVPLDKVSVSLVLSHPVAAGAVLAMYLAAAERRGYPLSDLRGTLQNDFLMETVVLTAPNVLEPAASFRLSADVVEFCLAQVPRWNAISYAGYNYREAGADAPLEVALVIAHAIAMTVEMTTRGHDVDSFAGRLTAFFSADNDFFEEIAKYRAARRVYAQVLSRLGARTERSRMLRYHVQTAGSALTAQHPLNNVARAAYHALAAVLGGAQSLHVSAFDEALSLPSEQAALVALHTQHVLLRETGVARTADPLAGSYFLEALTDEVDHRVRSLLEQIEHMGGLVEAVQRGWVHAQMLDRAYRRELEIQDGTREVVGVNCLQADEATSVAAFATPEARGERERALRRLRARRRTIDVRAALDRLRRDASDGVNTMPALLRAARIGCTLGECCGVFRDLYGGWRQPLF